MEEVKVSFETAKLAKEKGFRLPLDSNNKYFNDIGNIHPYSWFSIFELGDYTDAPTQALLQKWLREVKETEVIAFPLINNKGKVVYGYECLSMPTNTRKSLQGMFKAEYYAYCKSETYEEALEFGLQEGLNWLP